MRTCALVFGRSHLIHDSKFDFVETMSNKATVVSCSILQYSNVAMDIPPIYSHPLLAGFVPPRGTASPVPDTAEGGSRRDEIQMADLNRSTGDTVPYKAIEVLGIPYIP